MSINNYTFCSFYLHKFKKYNIKYSLHDKFYPYSTRNIKNGLNMTASRGCVALYQHNFIAIFVTVFNE